ncbi:hypothetical protein D7322_27305 [Sphingobacterium puteale]|uniref:Uncharacterized protein n=1 Tax=Sphingobacterium puteale TaxID=2420510 RepID=A0A420VPY0_9SPHI|nr:hypothetical protein [Sphingobacterium puteale]RKO68390.1 hypothetical protein D7322_27305 [Sphingobacterium puteale]
MKRIAILLFLVTLSGITFGQEKLWVNQTKVNEAMKFESQLNPDAKFLNPNIFMSSDYYPYLEKHPLLNPVVVERSALDYLPLSVEYFFSEKDSLLRIVSCDWEVNRYNNKSMQELAKDWKDENKQLDIYNKEYERIKKNMIQTFGQTSADDQEPKSVQSSWGSGTYLSRKTVWDNKDLHAQLDLIFSDNTHRIRLTYYWKDKEN